MTRKLVPACLSLLTGFAINFCGGISMTFRLVYCLAIALLGFNQMAKAEVLLFSSSANSNRVFISDSTNLGSTFTFEARIQFTSQFNKFGTIYREWDFAREDKQFQIGADQQRGFVFPNTSEFVANQKLRLGVWHHVAYVFDNGEERMYVNGCLVNSRSGLVNPRNDTRGTIRLGTHGKPGFEGYMDWFRLSNSVLFSSDSYIPPTTLAVPLSGDIMRYNFSVIGQSSFSNEANGLHQGILGPFTQIVAAPNDRILGDANGDGSLDLFDYDALWLAVADPATYSSEFPDIEIGLVGDLNGDQSLDILDLQIASKWFSIPGPSVISDASVFYAGTIFEEASLEEAIDIGKSLARETQIPTQLTFDNIVNASRGITGVIFDFQGMIDKAISIDDFNFQVSPTGLFDPKSDPASHWETAPPPTGLSLVPGSKHQVVLVWPGHSILNRWLRVTVMSTRNTRLAADETFYIGHLTGKSVGDSETSVYTVSFADIAEIRTHIGQNVGASSIYDINKSGVVSFSDISAMRQNVGTQLSIVTVP